MSLCATICRYFSKNTYRYLLLYLSLSSCIFAKIPAHTAPVSAPVSVPISAPISARLHRHDGGAICAVASPYHRRRIAVASPHLVSAASRRCKKHRRLADFIRSHLPVVQPTRRTRTEEMESQQRALMRKHVEGMVERL